MRQRVSLVRGQVVVRVLPVRRKELIVEIWRRLVLIWVELVVGKGRVGGWR